MPRQGLEGDAPARETPAVPRVLFIIPVVGVFAAVLGGGHWYIAQRVVLDARLPADLEGALLGSICLGLALLVLQPVGERLLRPPWSRLIAWPASLWMGLFFYLFLLVAFSDLLVVLGGALGPGQWDAAGLARARAMGVVAVALCFVATGIRGGLADPALKRLDIWLERWPDSLDGFRIVQLSDIHIGPIRGREFSQHLVERVNALSPDLVALTGDLVDGSVSKVASDVAPFGSLRARYGVFFVTGNHDHYSGAARWCDVVRGLGIRVLRNERVTLTVDGVAFELAGVDDHRSGFETSGAGEDLDAALAELSPDRAVILLAHDPSTFKRASSMGVDLQISDLEIEVRPAK